MEMLDFNALEQPTWPLKLKDKDHTVVNISAPTVELYDRLTAMVPELKRVAKTKDGQTLRAVFDLVAQVMSCNEDGFTFTAEELRDKYRMSLLDATKFVAGYMEFMAEIQNTKN